jgi:lipopolysaccharide transport system permease protein
MNVEKYEIVITPGKTMKNYWKELMSFRELFFILAWRDITVRYKQTVLGIMWTILRPILTMIVLTIVFSKIAKLPSEGVPYPLLVLVGMIPWQLFSSALSESSNSLISNASLLTKVYFPRIILPSSTIIATLVDFVISMILVFILMIYYNQIPSYRIIFMPFFLLLVLISSLGIGFFVASVNVKYRDFRYIVPFFVQFGLYITPVGFTSQIVSENWKLYYYLNPMAGAIDGFRWALLSNQSVIYLPGLLLSFTISILCLIFGIWYFRKTEKKFADLI